MAIKYVHNDSVKVDWALPFKRTSSFPIDMSSIFETYEDAEKYAKGDSNNLDSRGLGGSSYVGQIITVLDSDGNGTPKVYFISDTDGTLSEIAGEGGYAEVSKYKNNIITQKIDGLYAPKLQTANTPSVTLNAPCNGETLEEIFTDGIVFSHKDTNDNVFDSDEANAWYYDSSLSTIVQPLNTDTYTGFVSKSVYSSYVHEASLLSGDSDNDVIGLVIGYVIDSNGCPHTLSVLIQRGSNFINGEKYCVVYNYKLPNQEILFTSGNTSSGSQRPTIKGSTAWTRNSITLKVEKDLNEISVVATEFNSSTYNNATTISFDLDNYTWGQLFVSNVHYGYSCQSQADSQFKHIFFDGNGSLTADVNISAESGNQLVCKNDGLYVPISGIQKTDFLILDCGGALAKNEVGNISIKNSDGTQITSLALGVGNSYNIVVKDENGGIISPTNLTYVSSDSNVTVDSNGKVTVVYSQGMPMNINAVITVSTT